MKLKIATRDDFEKFILVKKEFFKDYSISKKSRDFILKEFEEYLKKGAIIIALKNEEIIGYLIGEIDENPYEKYGYISEVFVKKEHRSKGISTKLKDKFLEFLKEKEINICKIDVSPNNPAQETYKKWGFIIDKYRMSLRL